jgi:very-short-patch-repair endonuclease
MTPAGQGALSARLIAMCDEGSAEAKPVRSRDLLAAGVSRRRLSTPAWWRVHRGVRLWHEAAVDQLTLVQAAALLLPPGGAIGGRSAALVHGVDVRAAAEAPVELVVPRDTPLAPRPGVSIRRAMLPAADLTSVQGIQVTTPIRTAFDLARLEPLVEAVVCLDALLHAGLAEPASLGVYVQEHPRWRGVRRAAEALRYADGAAESPMETRLRMLLLLAGLPRPIVNRPLFDSQGRFLARPDLRIDRLLIEFDGQLHRAAAVFRADLRRQNSLVRAGYVVLRYTAEDVYQRGGAVVAEVRAALSALRRS